MYTEPCISAIADRLLLSVEHVPVPVGSEVEVSVDSTVTWRECQWTKSSRLSSRLLAGAQTMA